MKQKTCIIYDIFDAVKFLDDIKKSPDYLNAKAVLVNIFTERAQPDYISYLSDRIRQRLPKAQISGLTCHLGFAHGSRDSKSSVLTVLCFYKSEIQVCEYDFSKDSIESAKENFFNQIKNFSDLKGFQIFTTKFKNNFTNDFLNSITREFKDLPVFGAEAGYSDYDTVKKQYVFGNSIYDDGITITCFSGECLKIYAESTLGWTPIGRKMKATEVIDNHIIKTIDNQPAGEIYKKYLGVHSSKFFVENTCEFPFMIQRGNKWIARIPVKKDKNGYIHFTADIYKGESFLFSYGSKNNILNHSFKLAEYMSQKNLDGLLLHVCKNRHMYLKEAEDLEIEAFSNYYRETAGCFAFGEILYKNNNGGIYSSALIAVGFRELENDNNYTEDCFIENNRYGENLISDINKYEDDFSINVNEKEPIPFENRLVNFLHATSSDLYLANLKLEEAATIDGLTKIFNRKKISERISYELNKREKEKINIIMFDIDNFKHINDTYGHDMGDEVLVKIAETAKNCIRRQDSIGRWGGEEFMILLPHSQKTEAVKIAERIRQEIQNLTWDKIKQVTISLGVAQIREKDNLQTFYKRVDNRLYYAKQHGKNCVTYQDLED
ncbi:MAG: GGDEF domain-containing protein [Treponema sp.]|nr:GGDEF domain-containing protein [Treponema sp.]